MFALLCALIAYSMVPVIYRRQNIHKRKGDDSTIIPRRYLLCGHFPNNLLSLDHELIIDFKSLIIKGTKSIRNIRI